MNSNPYLAPSEPIEPPKVHSRLWTYLDIVAIICSLAPFLWFFTAGIYIGLTPLDQMPSDEAVGLSFLGTSLPWLVGIIYNLIGAARGRLIPRIGLVINAVSFIFFIALSVIAYIVGE
jgi:hypothetical protein